MTIPNTSVFMFYEGTDPAHYSDLTGLNLNAAAKALLANDVSLGNSVTNVEGAIANISQLLVSVSSSEAVIHPQGTGAITLDLNDTMYHQFNLDMNTTIGVTGFDSPYLDEIVLEITNGGNFAITWGSGTNPPFNWVLPDGSYGVNPAAAGVYLKTDGTSDFILIWSTDGGQTLYAKALR